MDDSPGRSSVRSDHLCEANREDLDDEATPINEAEKVHTSYPYRDRVIMIQELRSSLIVLKAVKVRIYPTNAQQAHLAQAFGCVRWVWNQSLDTMSQTYKQTGKGISAFDMKKQIPGWKVEHEWLKECYSQCLQQSVLNLSQAFINFFDGRAAYPTFKNRNGRQCIQYPANVKVLSDAEEIKFPGNLGVVKAKIHRDPVGKLKTVTVSRMPDGCYYASLLMDDGVEKPESSSEGKAIGIDLGLTDFAVTSDGSKYQNPRHLKKHECKLKRKQRQLSRNAGSDN